MSARCEANALNEPLRPGPRRLHNNHDTHHDINHNNNKRNNNHHTCVWGGFKSYIWEANFSCAANLRTNMIDIRGFDSSMMLILRCGIPRPMGNFPESLSQAIWDNGSREIGRISLFKLLDLCASSLRRGSSLHRSKLNGWSPKGNKLYRKLLILLCS